MKFQLEQIETRSLITDPISLAGVSMGLPLVWGLLGLTRTSSLAGRLATGHGSQVAQGQGNVSGKPTAEFVPGPR